MKPIRKYIYTDEKSDRWGIHRWGIFRVGSYNSISLFSSWKTFDKYKNAEKYLNNNIKSIGNFAILKIGNIGKIERLIINEKEVEKKSYALFSEVWNEIILEYHGIIKMCDIKQAKQKVGWEFKILPLRSNGRISLSTWKRLLGQKKNIIESKKTTHEMLNSNIHLYKKSLKNIRPTDEELVADTL